MAKYKIIGPRPVAGADPGKTVELDLPEVNIAALVKAGHVALVKPAAPKKDTASPATSWSLNGAAEDPREAR